MCIPTKCQPTENLLFFLSPSRHLHLPRHLPLNALPLPPTPTTFLFHSLLTGRRTTCQHLRSGVPSSPSGGDRSSQRTEERSLLLHSSKVRSSFWFSRSCLAVGGRAHAHEPSACMFRAPLMLALSLFLSFLQSAHPNTNTGEKAVGEGGTRPHAR